MADAPGLALSVGVLDARGVPRRRSGAVCVSAAGRGPASTVRLGRRCFFHSLANLPLDQPLLHGVVARFWQAPDLVVCIWIGMGLAAIRGLPARGLAIAALALAGAQAARHAREANHRHDFIVRDYGAAMVQAAPRDALILVRGDLMTNASRYVHHLEGLRPDVRIVDVEMLTKRWMTAQVRLHMPDVIVPGTHYSVGEPGGYLLRQLVDANIAQRPVVYCGGAKPGDASVEQSCRRWPLGLCDRLIATHPQPPAYYYKNLGIARARLAPADPASAELAVRALETYLRLAPAGDADIPAIRRVVQELAVRK